MKYILTTLICLLIAVPAMTQDYLQYPNSYFQDLPSFDKELLIFADNIGELQIAFKAGYITENHYEILLRMHLRAIKMHINNYCAEYSFNKFRGWYKYKLPNTLESSMIDTMKSKFNWSKWLNQGIRSFDEWKLIEVKISKDTIKMEWSKDSSKEKQCQELENEFNAYYFLPEIGWDVIDKEIEQASEKSWNNWLKGQGIPNFEEWKNKHDELHKFGGWYMFEIPKEELHKELKEILKKNREDFIDNNELWFLIQGQRELDKMRKKEKEMKGDKYKCPGCGNNVFQRIDLVELVSTDASLPPDLNNWVSHKIKKCNDVYVCPNCNLTIAIKECTKTHVFMEVR